MQLIRFLFVILVTLCYSVGPVSAETKKVGSWRLDLSSSFCIMEHNGWGQDIKISFGDIPGAGMRGHIEISGLKIKYGEDIWGDGIFDVYAPYSQTKGSFFYSREAGYNGIGIVSSLDQKGNYKDANMNTVIDFLAIVGGGGRFTIAERSSQKKVATFTLKKNKQASNLMMSCLAKIT